MPPIYRLKQWFARLGEDKPRPDGMLRCAACRAEVLEGEGVWFPSDGVVTCNDDCAADWQVDRSY